MSSAYDDDGDRDREDETEAEDRADRRDRLVRRAKEQVKTPAVFLLVVGVVGVLAALVGIVNVFTMDQQFARVEEQWDKDPNLNAQQKQDMKKMLGTYRDALKVGLPVSIGLSVITGLVTIFGAVKMMNLSGRGMAMAGSILCMFPCISGCCLLGLPVGIWALVVLARPEVKAGFAAAARAGHSPDGY